MRTSTNIRSTVFIALFAALFIVMSAIQIKVGAYVPITLQTLAVTLAGAILGPRKSFISLIIVIALTATGLPLLSGRGGLETLTGHTGGFIFAFPFCALLVGFATQAIFRSKAIMGNRIVALVALFIAFELFGSFLTYVPGVPWLMHVTGLDFGKAMTAGCYPYLPGDAIKSFVAAIIVLSLKPYILKIQSSMLRSQDHNQPIHTSI
ncbi:biotin transporter BioY [Paenibacillus glycanilyticus]|uniref:Biotin transporter n=1 Tax=Paenibacillus glycanilyticus TaxID=126569 RepID=A0ABQ6GFY8_9BACL|nr:biotin transporter BioY [Paenibacillus glycanilyticus]GLX68567.1 biotin transporter BioY [Paenibacillus glycanilyticus]